MTKFWINTKVAFRKMEIIFSKKIACLRLDVHGRRTFRTGPNLPSGGGNY